MWLVAVEKKASLASVAQLPKESSEVSPLPSFTFAHITRETDVRFFTGFCSSLMFKFVFDHLEVKARSMLYWKGYHQTVKEKPACEPSNKAGEYCSPGPERKLGCEQEFLMVMMRLHLGLMGRDLANRFQVSTGLISCVFTTWMKLMGKELK